MDFLKVLVVVPLYLFPAGDRGGVLALDIYRRTAKMSLFSRISRSDPRTPTLNIASASSVDLMLAFDPNNLMIG